METAILKQIQDELSLMHNQINKIDSIQDDINSMKDDINSLNKRFDFVETELISIKKSVLILENDLTLKIDTMLDTRIDNRNDYVRLYQDVKHMNGIVNRHTLEIELLQNKTKASDVDETYEN